MQGDESGYINFANNLLQGFYSPPAPDINLWWGPGYPILLMPFVGAGLPLIYITLLNAVFQYLSIVLLFKAMLYFVDDRKAILFTLLWAFCYSSYQYLYVIYTEAFTIFLISLLIFSIVKAFNTHLKTYLIFSGLILGYIALTKVIFGYVILLLLAGSILLWIRHRNVLNYRKSALIMIIAFTTTIPYLFYTYNLTGRLFYWGNSGGMSLYWMSTSIENEYGNWNNETFTANHIDSDAAGTTTRLKLNHQKEIDEVKKHKGVQKDDAYKKIAINNIITNPTKYLKNIISNISNMLFGFPNAYTYQRPLLKIWYFSIFYTLILFSLLPTLINWRKLSFSIRFLFIFTFIYLGGSSLVSVSSRQFIIIVPVLLIWIVYIIDQSITFKINFRKGD
jgi:4-amino-4-deoxy-L-arabinose transferase-like glycosyltransferase